MHTIKYKSATKTSQKRKTNMMETSRTPLVRLCKDRVRCEIYQLRWRSRKGERSSTPGGKNLIIQFLDLLVDGPPASRSALRRLCVANTIPSTNIFVVENGSSEAMNCLFRLAQSGFGSLVNLGQCLPTAKWLCQFCWLFITVCFDIARTLVNNPNAGH